MDLTEEEGRNIVWGDHEDWVEEKIEIVDTRRWSIDYEGVFKHMPSGRFYSLEWSNAATESSDESPFEYFAGLAMQGLLSVSYNIGSGKLGEIAVKQADKLLKELGKEE